MTIRLYKAYTPGTRNRSVLGFKELVKTNPQKKLTFWQHNKQGRNNRGVITSRFRGGGHKRLYRQIDFRRNKKKIYLEKLQPSNTILIELQTYVLYIMKMEKKDIFYILED